MRRMIRNKSWMKAVVAVLVLAFAGVGFAADLERIVPNGKVSIYQGDDKVGEYSAEAPFPDGALIACEGKCAAKLQDLYLVAADKTRFSVSTGQTSRKLMVENGTVYFALSQLPRPMVFITPAGVVTVERVILNAAADSDLLKGYVNVTEEASEIGVIEGGSMQFATTGWEEVVPAGKRVILAQQTGGIQAAEGGAAAGGVTAGTAIVPVVALGGVVAAGVIAADKDDVPASPVQP